MELPLANARIIDLTRNVAGPYASLILANLGADVIKVEHPLTGDDARQWGPPFWQGESPAFLAFNRDKRSITLDLRQGEARTVLERAVRSADVMMESFRPGALDALGFGYDWASALNERIVYCSVTSYGEVGPMRDAPGYDPIMQALGGIMSVTGEPDGEPVRVGTSLVDMGTGMWAALATLAALMKRQQTGKGQHVSVSLYETALAWMVYHLPTYWGTDVAPARQGSRTTMLAPNEAFRTQDGHLLLSCGNDRLFRVLTEALERPGWLADRRFASNPDRVRNREALHKLIEAVTEEWPAESLASKLRAAGVPCAPIRDAAGVAADPQAAALGIFQCLEHPFIPNFRSVGMPFTLNSERPPARRVPPEKGQHNRDVLLELGFTSDEAERLASSPSMLASGQSVNQPERHYKPGEKP